MSEPYETLSFDQGVKELEDAELIKEGDYQAKIAEVYDGTSQDSGDKWANVQFEITEGPYAGRRVKHFLGSGLQYPGRRKRVLQLTKATGYTPKGPWKLRDMKDLPCRIRVKLGTNSETKELENTVFPLAAE